MVLNCVNFDNSRCLHIKHEKNNTKNNLVIFTSEHITKNKTNINGERKTRLQLWLGISLSKENAMDTCIHLYVNGWQCMYIGLGVRIWLIVLYLHININIEEGVNFINFYTKVFIARSEMSSFK